MKTIQDSIKKERDKLLEAIHRGQMTSRKARRLIKKFEKLEERAKAT